MPYLKYNYNKIDFNRNYRKHPLVMNGMQYYYILNNNWYWRKNNIRIAKKVLRNGTYSRDRQMDSTRMQTLLSKHYTATVLVKVGAFCSRSFV